MGKVLCEGCKKKCVGSALRVQDKHFHVDCFKCSVCSTSLAHGGFFLKEGHYYCAKDYQKKFGTKCVNCGEYVEGEVVTALGNTYHQKCFVCARCRQPFPTGEKVTFTGKECLCSKCIQIPIVTSKSPEKSLTQDELQCAGCKELLKEGQALIALDKQWHIWCFNCTVCGTVLHGEYMGKNGLPYCEKDYQKKFGVKCVHCDRFITGKVLQAGDNSHFHPTCARCTKCGDPFGDGEEMFMQEGTGKRNLGFRPISTKQGMQVLDLKQQYQLTSSPSLHGSHSFSSFGSFNRKYGRTSPGIFAERDLLLSDLSRVYTHSYLTEEPIQGYLRRPIDPRPPKSPQFHRPPEGTGKRNLGFRPISTKQGMQVLVESIQATTPRPRSPHMNNEEPIELAHYPGAQPPKAYEVPRIERDDFPAPPFPYTDAERCRRWSGSSKDADIDEELEEEEIIQEDPQLKKEEEELAKIATGIGKVFLKTVKERERIRAWKRIHLDPRNASRTPSANKEPHMKLRYDNPVNASPSRDADHPKPWEDDDFDQRSGYRSSTGRYAGTIPNYNMVSSLRAIPKPGYGLAIKSSLGRDSSLGFTSSELGCGKFEKTHSSEFGSGRSDISSISEQGVLSHSSSGIFRSTPYSEGYRGMRYSSYSPHLRRSMPNVNLHLSSEPPKLYPYHLLITTNYRLPPDVDRCHLERHLSNDEFHSLFNMTRLQFYRLPEWRRNEIKRKCMLF
ncbi:actin-binding LIM protein 3-like [Centruroides sculpturatus]|uniref:actin-binding LIM protein 3-like n=1 Tax=Centruroides sculpturatus TaxID=218467 RepID=UPI000C6D6AFD|nr:actin-binding LIM protein 3-like [Centruroides sculpturatus]